MGGREAWGRGREGGWGNLECNFNNLMTREREKERKMGRRKRGKERAGQIGQILTVDGS